MQTLGSPQGSQQLSLNTQPATTFGLGTRH